MRRLEFGIRESKRRGVIAFLSGRRNPRKGWRRPYPRIETSMAPRPLGLLIVLLGAAVVVVGLLVWTGALSWFGRLPGDVRIERDSVRIFFPWVSMLLISLVLTLVLNLLRRFF